MGDRLATMDMGRKGGCCAPSRGGVGSPSNTMSPGQRPTSVPNGILIHPTVWPQYTDVTDRQPGQTDRTDDGPIAQGEPFYKQSPKNKEEDHPRAAAMLPTHLSRDVTSSVMAVVIFHGRRSVGASERLSSAQSLLLVPPEDLESEMTIRRIATTAAASASTASELTQRSRRGLRVLLLVRLA